MVAFSAIPNVLRVPFTAVEFDASRASRGPSVLAYRACLVGQKHGAGTAAANTRHRVTNSDQVASLAGRGSMLHRQAIAWFAGNKSTELWILVLADNAAGLFASGSITLAGTATGAGVISLYLGGCLVQVPVAVGDAASAVAATLATATGKHATGTVTFVTPSAADNVTIAGVQFVGTAGAVTPGDATYSVDTSAAAAATSLAAQVKAHAVASQKVRATSNAGVVALVAIEPGTAGNSIALVTTDVVNVAISGATLVGGVAGQNPDLAVYATVDGAAVTFHANNAGAVGNEFDVRLNYLADAESLPPGITATIAQPTGGASNPSLTAAIASLGDSWFHVLSHPYTDATSLTAIETELTSRNGPMRMIDGVAITAKDDSFANVAALGDSRNSAHSVILRTAESPTPVAEYAAHVAGVVAYYGQIDPARPLHTLPLPFILAPAEADREKLETRNQIVGNGISTTRVGGSDLVQIEALVTTYRTNAAGSPDTAYRSLNTMLTLMYARYDFRVRMATKYPRHKLGNDSVRYPDGEAIMTPQLGRAEAISWFLDMSTASPVVFDPSALAQFKADLVVERNVSDPNRLDFLLPPDLINQLVVSAAQIQFRL